MIGRPCKVGLLIEGISENLFFLFVLVILGNSDYLSLLCCCSTMDPIHACARDGDVEGLAKLLDQDGFINVKGAFNSWLLNGAQAV